MGTETLVRMLETCSRIAPGTQYAVHVLTVSIDCVYIVNNLTS